MEYYNLIPFFFFLTLFPFFLYWEFWFSKMGHNRIRMPYRYSFLLLPYTCNGFRVTVLIQLPPIFNENNSTVFICSLSSPYFLKLYYVNIFRTFWCGIAHCTLFLLPCLVLVLQVSVFSACHQCWVDSVTIFHIWLFNDESKVDECFCLESKQRSYED